MQQCAIFLEKLHLVWIVLLARANLWNMYVATVNLTNFIDNYIQTRNLTRKNGNLAATDDDAAAQHSPTCIPVFGQILILLALAALLAAMFYYIRCYVIPRLNERTIGSGGRRRPSTTPPKAARRTNPKQQQLPRRISKSISGGQIGASTHSAAIQKSRLKAKLKRRKRSAKSKWEVWWWK